MKLKVGVALLKLGEYISLALTEIFHNKIRTFLTLLGIIIGIAAVIIIIFVVQGAEVYLMSELDSMIPLDLIELTGRWDPDTQRMLGNVTIDDLDYISAKLGSEIRAMTSIYQNSGELNYQGNSYDADIVATTADFQEFYDMTLRDGRFLTDVDNEFFNQVIVLGYETAENLFKGERAVGQKVTLYGSTFTVIGILPEAYKSPIVSAATNDSRGFIPLSVFERFFAIKDRFYVLIRGSSQSTISLTQNKIIELLNQKNGLTPDGESKFQAYNLSEGMDQINIIKIVLMVLLSGVASITLFVAGIGVMNIMLVIITERTKEIGLRKALGATRKDILSQFIIESIILCILGGIFGILIGYFTSNLLMDYAREFINVEVSVPAWAVILSLIFTSGVGLFFGIYPAAKAAKLDPIEALQYE